MQYFQDKNNNTDNERGFHTDWVEAMKNESEAAKDNLKEILKTIARLDNEYNDMKEERERRMVGDDLLLSLMDDYDQFKTGKQCG